MMDYFIDSSSVIKRYIPEQGTAWVQSITAPSSRNNVIISVVTPVEIMSGVMRRNREGTIKLRTVQAVRLLVDRHASREYMVIGVSAAVVQRAKDLLQSYPLRAYDSIQLASALESNSRLIGAGLLPLTFIASDQRLLDAASAESLLIDDANLHA